MFVELRAALRPSITLLLFFTLLTGLILMGIALIVGEVIRLLLFRKKR